MGTLTNKVGDHVRQGDILIEVVESLPKKGLTPLGHKDGRLIVAEGEATGHNHAVDSGTATLYASENDPLEVDGRYIVTTEEADLVHEEHDTLTLPKDSILRVTRQREHVDEDIVHWVRD